MCHNCTYGAEKILRVKAHLKKKKRNVISLKCIAINLKVIPVEIQKEKLEISDVLFCYDAKFFLFVFVIFLSNLFPLT